MKSQPEGTMKGFTLVEVMVVLVIVAVLGALAYPTYAGYVRKSRRIEGQVALVETMQQEERYYTQHNSYKAFSATTPDVGAFRWWSGSAAAQSAYEIDAAACPGHALEECVQLRARPGTAKVDVAFHDPECETLTLDSTGQQASSGSLAACWP
jgi:type IV pilus assembly protein PilE